MTRSTSAFLLASSLGLAVGMAHAGDSVVFTQLLGVDSATDLSPDGRFYVGDTDTTGPYIYDNVTQTMTLLPDVNGSSAVAVSDDGKVVLGTWYEEFNPGQWAQVACRWTEQSGQWTSLGFLPSAGFCPSRSNGYELSGDGTVAVGLSWVGCSGRGFRWTEATGMVELESLLNGANRASVVSADGNVIGGFAQAATRTPVAWGGTGVGVVLDPPSGAALGEIEGINDSGTIMLGGFNTKATKFTNGGTVRTQIGAGSLLPGWVGHPMDISNNGTIVGFDTLAGNRRAWIQVGGTGPIVDLRAYAEANGANIPPEMLLEVAQAINADGTFIIGHGFGGAWTIRLPSPLPCLGDLAPAGGNGVIDGADLGALLAAWGTPAADLDGDSTTGGSDLGILLGGWGGCPVAPGACCTGDDCVMTSALACAQLGGVFQGNGVPCSENSCVNNDHCIDAVDVTSNINAQVVSGDNTTATPAIYSEGDAELPAGTPSCQWLNEPWQVHATVWYTFVAPPNGNLTIELCQSSPVPFFDSMLAVYTGTCGDLVEYACDEDGCSDTAPYYSRLELPFLTPGQTYYICVMNSGGWLHSVPGPFKLGLWSNNGPGGGAN
jgi:hypothetical protein